MTTSVVRNEIPAVPPEQRIHFVCARCGKGHKDLNSMARCWLGHKEDA